MIFHKLGLATILSLGMSMAAWSLVGTSAATARADEPIIITGEVLRFEPGKTIVIRSGGKEVTYMLTPNVVLPAEIQVGKTASLQVEAGPNGAQLVKTVTTTTVGPGGQVKETTETTRTDAAGETTTTTATTLTGTVETYLPGKSVTVLDPKGSRVTYVLSPDSSLPAEMLMGKQVTIYVAKGQPRAVYFLERDGDKIRIKLKKVD